MDCSCSRKQKITLLLNKNSLKSCLIQFFYILLQHNLNNITKIAYSYENEKRNQNQEPGR